MDNFSIFLEAKSMVSECSKLTLATTINYMLKTGQPTRNGKVLRNTQTTKTESGRNGKSK